MTEAEKRMKRCCFTGHRPSKLKQDEQTIKRSLAAAIDQAISATISQRTLMLILSVHQPMLIARFKLISLPMGAHIKAR